jgi:hypothetical protein
MTGLAILGCGYVANIYRLTLPMHPELRILGTYDRETARTTTFLQHEIAALRDQGVTARAYPNWLRTTSQASMYHRATWTC